MKSSSYKFMDTIKQPTVSGQYELFHINHDGKWDDKPFAVNKNKVMFHWGFIAAKCIGQGDADYKINAAYIEYKNVALGGDDVTIPIFDRSDGLDYFNGLPADQDFLRVTLTGTPSISIATGYGDLFVAGESGNKVTFVAQTAGTLGVLGRDFSDSVNSKVFGVSLVATPLFSDRTKDVILSRGYFSVDDQTLKTVGQQIGVRWIITFE